MPTFAQDILDFNYALHFDGPLPAGIRISNPFKDNDYASQLSAAFYLGQTV